MDDTTVPKKTGTLAQKRTNLDVVTDFEALQLVANDVSRGKTQTNLSRLNGIENVLYRYNTTDRPFLYFFRHSCARRRF